MGNNQTIIIGADHAGFALKQHLAEYLLSKGYPVTDVGCHSQDRVDYPDNACDVVCEMARQKGALGIICCGSGIGVSIAANRYTGIRAVLANDETTAKWSRLHNDANVLCMGGRLIAPSLAEQIVDVWLTTPFEGGRHQGRIEKLDTLNCPLSNPGESPQQCSV